MDAVDNESLGVACYRAPELRCEGYYWRAQAYFGLGKKAAAVRDLERISTMLPSFRDVQMLLK